MPLNGLVTNRHVKVVKNDILRRVDRGGGGRERQRERRERGGGAIGAHDDVTADFGLVVKMEEIVTFRVGLDAGSLHIDEDIPTRDVTPSNGKVGERSFG